MEVTELLAAMTTAAEAISAHEELFHWRNAAVYLLQILDLRLESKELGLGKAFLRQVEVHLSNRIELGHWVE